MDSTQSSVTITSQLLVPKATSLEFGSVIFILDLFFPGSHLICKPLFWNTISQKMIWARSHVVEWKQYIDLEIFRTLSESFGAFLRYVIVCKDKAILITWWQLHCLDLKLIIDFVRNWDINFRTKSACILQQIDLHRCLQRICSRLVYKDRPAVELYSWFALAS